MRIKNTTLGGVFHFMVHLQGFEPGTHCIPLAVSCVICRVRPTNSKFRVSCSNLTRKKRKRSAKQTLVHLQGFDSPRELRSSVIRRENSSTGRVFYTAPTSNPFDAYKKHHARWCFSFYGAPSGIRTRDPLIKSQLLYQLS